MKGGCPVRIAHRMPPSANTSARASIASPRACSGAMYAGVPSTVPACVWSSVDSPERGGRWSGWRPCRRWGRSAPPTDRGSSAIPAGQVLGQAPVHHLHFAEGPDHDVGRLQVAVDDAATVGEADRLADLRERLEQPRPVGGLHLVGQGLPGDEFHGQEGGAVGQRPQGVDRRDARMRQPGGDLRLADEAVGVGPGQQDLERDVAVEAEVVGGEDAAHAAAGDLAQHR